MCIGAAHPMPSPRTTIPLTNERVHIIEIGNACIIHVSVCVLVCYVYEQILWRVFFGDHTRVVCGRRCGITTMIIIHYILFVSHARIGCDLL